MQPKSNPQSKLSQTLTQKLSFIHKTLLNLGCNLVPTTPHPQQKMNPFFTATDSRLELIEWLIAIIYPGYKLQEEYRNCYHEDPELHRIRRLGIILWRLGVMPVSKHTKNLDYDKFIQGLLGYESSLNLIYSLTELAEQKFAPNIHKIEQIASQLLGDLIKNNNQLVNPDYDPYGVTFPPRQYMNEREQQTDVDEEYGQLLKEIKEWQKKRQQNEEIKEDEEEMNRIFRDVEVYRELFARKYEKLRKAIETMVDNYEKIVPIEDTKQLHDRRVLNISKSLCKNYRKYKKTLTEIAQPTQKSTLKSLKSQLTTTIASLNEIHTL